MRFLFLAAVILGMAGLAHADDKKADTSLKVGDPAPKLKADKWLQGDEVKEFAKDKVYVVEFWATWCGPCIAIMPHVAEMQAEYKGKGVTFIGYTAKDDNNDMEKVTAFVTKRGPKLGYTFAYADNRDTYDAWMKAAGQGGIPCTFVVDKAGKIAYIGHPMFLDLVMPKVVAGTWKEEDRKSLETVENEINEVFKALGGPDADAGLKALADLEAKYPAMAKIPYFVYPKMDKLLKAKKNEEAKKFGEEVIARALKLDDESALRTVSAALRSPSAKDQKDLGELSLKAAEAGLKVAGDKDAMALMNVAETHFALGNKAKAKEYGAMAMAAASNPQQKQSIEQRVKKYEDEK
jgi:thiol-disulfide isomerase/thioredoxin